MRKFLCVLLCAAMMTGMIQTPVYASEVELSEEEYELLTEDVEELVEEQVIIDESEPITDETLSLADEGNDDPIELVYPGEFVQVEEDREVWGESIALIHILCPDFESIVGYSINVSNISKDLEVSEDVYFSEDDAADGVIALDLFDVFKSSLNDPQIYDSENNVFNQIEVKPMPILADDCGYKLKDEYPDFCFTNAVELPDEKAGYFILTENMRRSWNDSSMPVDLYCPDTSIVSGYKIVIRNFTNGKTARTLLSVSDGSAGEKTIQLDLVKDEFFSPAGSIYGNEFQIDAMPVLNANSGYKTKKTYKNLVLFNQRYLEDPGKLALTEEDYTKWNENTGAPIRIECPDTDIIIGYEIEVKKNSDKIADGYIYFDSEQYDIYGKLEPDSYSVNYDEEEPTKATLYTDLTDSASWNLKNIIFDGNSDTKITVSVTPLVDSMSGYAVSSLTEIQFKYPNVLEDVGKIVVSYENRKKWGKESMPLQIECNRTDIIAGYSVRLAIGSGIASSAKKDYYFPTDGTEGFSVDDDNFGVLDIDIVKDLIEDSKQPSDPEDPYVKSGGMYHRNNEKCWDKNFFWLFFEGNHSDFDEDDMEDVEYYLDLGNKVIDEKPLIYDFKEDCFRNFDIFATPILKENSGYQLGGEPSCYDWYHYSSSEIVTPDDTVVYETAEEAYEAMRDIHRQRLTTQKGGYVMYVRDDAFPLYEALMDKIFDKYSEREGMKPDEGDYMLYCAADRKKSYWNSSTYVLEAGLNIKDEYVYKITFTTPFITTRAEEDKVDAKVKDIINGDLAGVKNSSNEAKAKAAYNWIVNHVSSSGGDRTEPIKHTAYNAFINGNATCQGYALAYGRLLRELGVPNKVIMGTDANAHTYNIVLMNKEADGKQYYYYVDTSAGIFKKDYNSFSRTEEQSHYKTPSFIANYTSKIKGYEEKNKNAVVEVLDSDNKVVYSAGTLLMARSYIINAIECDIAENDAETARRKAKQDDDVFYDPDSEEPITDPHYTIRLLSDLTSVSKGDIDFSDVSERDISNVDVYAATWNYGKYVSLDLNGKTLTVKKNADYIIRTDDIANGTIKLNAGSTLYCAGANDYSDYSKCSNVSFVGPGKSGTLYVSSYVEIDDTCSISSISNAYFDDSSNIIPEVEFSNVTLQSGLYDVGINLSRLTTDNLILRGPISVDEEYETNKDFGVGTTVGSLTVNKKTTIVGHNKIRVRNNITLKGNTVCTEKTSNSLFYGYLELMLLKSSDGNIGQMNLSGTFDNRYVKPEYGTYGYMVYTGEKTYKPIRVDVIDDDVDEYGNYTVSHSVIPVNAVFGTINAKGYISATSQVTINNDNVTDFISLNPYIEKEEGADKYSYQVTANQKLDLTEGILTYADLMEGEVSGGSKNANYRVTYFKDGDQYNRHYETLDNAIDVIKKIDEELDETQPEVTERDYTLTILQKENDVHLATLPEFENMSNTYSLTVKGDGVKSVYLETAPNFSLSVDVSTAAKSFVYIVDLYKENTDDFWPVFKGDTQVIVKNEDDELNNSISNLFLRDNAKLIVNAPLTVGLIVAGDNASVQLGESTVGKQKYYGYLDVSDVAICNTDGSNDGTLGLIDTLKYTYRAKQGAKTVLSIPVDDSGRISYTKTTAYGQHLILSSEDEGINTYDVTAGISKITCKSVKSQTLSDKSKYSGIKQEMNTTAKYAYTLQAEEADSSDELEAISSDKDYVEASINMATKQIEITTKVVPAVEKASEITIRNTTTDEDVLKFYITTTNPAWNNTTPTASLASSSDIDFVFKLSAPKGLKITEGFYYGIKLLPLKKGTSLNAGTQLNTEEKFIKLESTNTVSMWAFADEYDISNKVEEYGKGLASKMNAEINIYLTKDGCAPHDIDNPDLTNVVTKTAAKKVKKLNNIATKTPYFATKIGYKKGKTSVYPGQSKVKIADITFDKKVTYNNNTYWEASCDTEGITVYKGESKNDMGVYVSADSTVLPGKYTVRVATFSDCIDNNYATASINFTVPKFISNIDVKVGNKFSGDKGGIYKAKNSALSVKATITATASDNSAIKNPAVTCAVLTYGEEKPVSSDLIRIDNNGKITMAKGCPAGDYILRVKAADYPENTNYVDAQFSIVDEAVECSDIILYDYSNPEYPVKFDSTQDDIHANMDIRVQAVDSQGDPLPEYTYSCSMTSGFLATNPGFFVKTGYVTYTVTTISGQKKSLKVEVFDADKDNVFLDVVQMSTGGDLTFYPDEEASTETDKVYVCDISGLLYSPGEIFEASLYFTGVDGKKHFATETATDVTLSGNGISKISNTKNQIVRFQKNAAESSIILTRGTGKNTKTTETYKIINNNYVNQTAPTASLDKAVYADYAYENGDEIVIKLKKSLPDFYPESGIIRISNIQCNMQDINPEWLGEPMYSEEVVKNKTVCKVKIPITHIPDGDTMYFRSGKTYKIAFDFYDKNNNALTKNSAVITIKPSKFKQSFKLTTSYNLKVSDSSSAQLTGKKTGVADITFESLLNSNEKGVFNNFTDIFDITEDGELTYSDVALEEGSTLIPRNNKGAYQAVNGYVKYTITYESGKKETRTDKIKVVPKVK